ARSRVARILAGTSLKKLMYRSLWAWGSGSDSAVRNTPARWSRMLFSSLGLDARPGGPRVSAPDERGRTSLSIRSPVVAPPRQKEPTGPAYREAAAANIGRVGRRGQGDSVWTCRVMT